jgi:hypothetical protein
MLTFLVSLIVGHAILLLLKVYIPPAYNFSLRFGQAIALLFKITYDQKIMAAFIIATILSFFMGILFHKLLKLSR